MSLQNAYLDSFRFIGEGTPVRQSFSFSSGFDIPLVTNISNYFGFTLEAGVIYRTRDIVGTALAFLGLKNRYILNSTIQRSEAGHYFTYEDVPQGD